MPRFGAAQVTTVAAVPTFLNGAPVWAQNHRDVTHPCNRACLTRTVDAYVAALIANDASRLPLAPGAKLTLNDDMVAAERLLWDQATSVQSRVDIANPRLGDTGTQAVITNADGSQFLY